MMEDTAIKDLRENKIFSPPKTLCFDVRFFGTEKDAEKYLVRQFQFIKERLSAINLISLHEPVTRVEQDGSVSFRKRVHVQAISHNPDWNTAKSIVRECFNTGSYFVDFINKPKAKG